MSKELVKELRAKTGAGYTTCNDALKECDNNVEKAIEYIQKQGAKIAAVRSGRKTEHGLVIASIGSKCGTIVALTCETEPVTKTEKFKAFLNEVSEYCTKEEPVTIDEIKAQFEEKLNELIAVIGEKIEIDAYIHMDGEFIGKYNHHDSMKSSLVLFNKAVEEHVSKNIAMQVISMRPLWIDILDIPDSVSEKEWDIQNTLAIAENTTSEKPKDEETIRKIVNGKVQKNLKNLTLMNQTFAGIDTEGKFKNKTVKEYLQTIDKDLKVLLFRSYSI